MTSNSEINQSTTWKAYGDCDTDPYFVILFYQYVHLEAPEQEAIQQRELCQKNSLLGRLLIGKEGINGTLAGTREDIETYVHTMQQDARFANVDFKCSSSKSKAFPDLLIKTVREIISTGGVIAPELLEQRGQHLTPQEFHQMLSDSLTKGSIVSSLDDEDTAPTDDSGLVLLDCRNMKESAIGHFEGAQRIPMRTFAEYPKFVDDQMEKLRNHKVMMYCTGGIRCEKASAYLRAKGVKEVYQLKGGIHRYLESYPDGGLFKGKNFVFDGRVALAPSHSLNTSDTTSTNKNDEIKEETPISTRTIVGHCYNCIVPWDTVDGATVCTVCRDSVLVCKTCRPILEYVFYCDSHRSLQGIYFSFLDHFSIQELETQLNQLKEHHKDLLLKGRQFKNKRRTLQRQIDRIQDRIDKIQHGEVTPCLKPERPPCRTCGVATCTGTCWGFHAETDQTIEKNPTSNTIDVTHSTPLWQGSGIKRRRETHLISGATLEQ